VNAPGWFKTDGAMAHYFGIDVRSLCGKISKIGTVPWSVFQDVGRVPTCEACKKRLRK